MFVCLLLEKSCDSHLFVNFELGGSVIRCDTGGGEVKWVIGGIDMLAVFCLSFTSLVIDDESDPEVNQRRLGLLREGFPVCSKRVAADCIYFVTTLFLLNATCI